MDRGDRTSLGGGYFRGKIAQENLVKDSAVPYTIVRATQFGFVVNLIAERLAAVDASSSNLAAAQRRNGGIGP